MIYGDLFVDVEKIGNDDNLKLLIFRFQYLE